MAVSRSITATPSAFSRLAPVGIHLAGKAFVNLGGGGVACNGFEHLDGALKESKGKARERGVLTSESEAPSPADPPRAARLLARSLELTASAHLVNVRAGQSPTTYLCESLGSSSVLGRCARP